MTIFSDRERQDLRKALDLERFYGTLGDANGVIYDRNGYLRVRYKAANGMTAAGIARLGPSVSLQMKPDAAIVLGHDRNELVIIGADVVSQIAAGFNTFRNNAADENVTSKTATSDIVTFVSHPTSPVSKSVAVRSLVWIYGRTVNLFNGSSVDLTSTIPAAGNHRLAGLFLKQDGTIEVSASTTQDMSIPLDLTDVQECITGSTMMSIAGHGWYLHDNQATITDDDYALDMRPFINVPEYNWRPLRVVTAAGDVTVTTTDYTIVVNKSVGAATAVNLPASPATGLTFVIKDGKADANTNNITLTPAAGNIDGAATYVMNVARQSRTIQYTGSEWSIIGGYL